MQGLSDPRVIRPLLEKYGFHFSKALGQNFLVDGTVCPKMASLCGASETGNVLEIGPGIGVLTYELAQKARRVAAVELDRRLFPLLSETLADCPNVRLVEGDAMKLDFAALLAEQFGGERAVVCANLPYYITSPLVMRLLEERLPIDSITVMVQKEAAERLCAEPGTRASGAVSAAVRYFAEPEILFHVGRGSFFPAPNVDSAVIRLRLREKPPVEVEDEALFFRTVRASFAQRRKTAVNSVSNTMGMEKDAVRRAFSAAGLPENARAEALRLEDFARLCAALARERNGKTGEKGTAGDHQ